MSGTVGEVGEVKTSPLWELCLEGRSDPRWTLDADTSVRAKGKNSTQATGREERRACQVKPSPSIQSIASISTSSSSSNTLTSHHTTPPHHPTHSTAHSTQHTHHNGNPNATAPPLALPRAAARAAAPRGPAHAAAPRLRDSFRASSGTGEAEAVELVRYLRAQRMYATLLERYNPGLGRETEDRVRLSARRVGLEMPKEMAGRG
ncbi:uncharacterized protein LAJ45_06598 [Morchella importuna]|uniref:uncharacterized protein n=1 Tax=Morchella importuna TaxID=1174673 RepID=UPI001E8E17E5|nr:uncharacterized protein LAJ45_06598 [Morchella importuna]KAH8149518.1 hypothetical protein LAJ45_06598 [Morchella importuna]